LGCCSASSNFPRLQVWGLSHFSVSDREQEKLLTSSARLSPRLFFAVLPELKVADDPRHLSTVAGKPVFLLGDTVCALFMRWRGRGWLDLY
jgi:hypothetical protein